jgi:hypothetical protein
MAPKSKEKTSAQPAETQCVSAKAAPKLQKRVYGKAEQEVLCAARQDGKQLDGKQLINAVQYHLKKTPEHIRQVYTKQVKYGKGMTKAERKEFIEHLISNDWNNE